MQPVFQGSFAEAIEALAAKPGLSQRRIAEQVGVDKGKVSAWKAGSGIKGENLLGLARAAQAWPDLFWFFVERAGLSQEVVLKVQRVEAARPTAVAHRISAGVERTWRPSEKQRKVK